MGNPLIGICAIAIGNHDYRILSVSYPSFQCSTISPISSVLNNSDITTRFLFTWLAISPLNPDQIPQLYTAFSFAWLLGLLIPGAPGGLGVFEATAIALLDRHFSAGVILSVVALFRLVSILAEATGAGLATLSERRWGQK